MNANRLFLFCEGKQVGYRHLGDIDQLDIGSDAPFSNDRFFYNTSPLPLEVTRGKREVSLEIRATGTIWGYGTTFDQYQKPMTQPTRGLYCIYTHTDGAFVPPTSEKQGIAPINPPVRYGPGEEVLDVVTERVNREIDARMKSTNPLNQMQVQLVAKAYHLKWTRAYHQPQAVDQVLKSLDAIYRAYRANPKLAQADPATYNAEWFGLGPSGQVMDLMRELLQAKWDESIDVGLGGKVSRRAGFRKP